jgi:hypothetical protein
VTYTALLWMEKEHGAGRRVLVRDITFPWVHHESADSALEHAILISTTARAVNRHVETETAPHDTAPRGTGDSRGSAGTTAPIAPGAAATAAPASSPVLFER